MQKVEMQEYKVFGDVGEEFSLLCRAVLQGDTTTPLSVIVDGCQQSGKSKLCQELARKFNFECKSYTSAELYAGFPQHLERALDNIISESVAFCSGRDIRDPESDDEEHSGTSGTKAEQQGHAKSQDYALSERRRPLLVVFEDAHQLFPSNGAIPYISKKNAQDMIFGDDAGYGRSLEDVDTASLRLFVARMQQIYQLRDNIRSSELENMTTTGLSNNDSAMHSPIPLIFVLISPCISLLHPFVAQHICSHSPKQVLDMETQVRAEKHSKMNDSQKPFNSQLTSTNNSPLPERRTFKTHFTMGILSPELRFTALRQMLSEYYLFDDNTQHTLDRSYGDCTQAEGPVHSTPSSTTDVWSHEKNLMRMLVAPISEPSLQFFCSSYCTGYLFGDLSCLVSQTIQVCKEFLAKMIALFESEGLISISSAMANLPRDDGGFSHTLKYPFLTALLEQPQQLQKLPQIPRLSVLPLLTRLAKKHIPVLMLHPSISEVPTIGISSEHDNTTTVSGNLDSQVSYSKMDLDNPIDAPIASVPPKSVSLPAKLRFETSLIPPALPFVSRAADFRPLVLKQLMLDMHTEEDALADSPASEAESSSIQAPNEEQSIVKKMNQLTTLYMQTAATFAQEESSRNVKGMGTSFLSSLSSGASLLVPQIPHTPWSQVGGQDEAKYELQKILWQIKGLPLTLFVATHSRPESQKKSKLDQIRKRYQEALGGTVSTPMAIGSDSTFHAHCTYSAHANVMNGILLFGPPGTGKTLLAKAAATELGSKFISVSIPQILKGGVGDSEKALFSIFRTAIATAPTVVFLDEIQALFAKRDGGGNDEASRMSNILNKALMHCFDMIAHHQQLLREAKHSSTKGSSNASVLVIAATNIPEALDSALFQPGRFEQAVYIGPPNFRDRVHIFLQKLKLMQVVGSFPSSDEDTLIAEFRNLRVGENKDNYSQATQLSDEDQLKKDLAAYLARHTEGYSGADCVSVINKAVELAVAESPYLDLVWKQKEYELQRLKTQINLGQANGPLEAAQSASAKPTPLREEHIPKAVQIHQFLKALSIVPSSVPQDRLRFFAHWKPPRR